jgi:hypothetical protein
MYIPISTDPAAEQAMHNRTSEVRRLIRTLRISMLEAEAVMRGKINRDEDCSFVAGEILKMRAIMSGLVQERTILGDNEPIVVNGAAVPGRAHAPVPVMSRSGKRPLTGRFLSVAQL